MRNKTITGLFLSLGTIAFAQVGINTADPKVTFDIMAKNATGTLTAPEGLLLPRVDRQKAQSMINIPESTLIYIDDATTGTQFGIAANIDREGYYFFDGKVWIKLNPSVDGIDQDNNIYNTDGTLLENRIVSQGDKTLTFTGSAVNAFSVDGNTFSVNAQSSRIGIGTTTPVEKVHVNGAIAFTGQTTVNKIGAGTIDYVFPTESSQTRILSWGPDATTNGAISFWTGLGGAGASEKMRIHSDGNVGIGTVTPLAKLDMVGTVFGMKNSTGSGSWDNLWFNVNPRGASINASGAEDGMQFKVGANGVGTYGDQDQVLTTVATMLPNGNMGIGTSTPANSAILELSATNKGFLPPRLTTAQRNALNPKPAGLMVYNVNTNCLEFWDSASWVSTCAVTAPPAGTIVTLNCAGATHNGSIVTGANTSVTSVIPYTGGNSGTHGGQTVASTGVTGLTATLVAGSFANGAGNLTYTITGTPSGVGTASFALNIGGQTCTISRTVTAGPGSVAGLNCGTATNNGTLTSGTVASGVSSVIPYTGGNGGAHSGQAVNSTGVTGLTATLTAGSFANGAGNLTYTITGTPSSAGTANFAINIGGKTCTLTRTVVLGNTVLLPGNNKAWMRHNLGADTSFDPDVPVQQIHGNLYQWGRANVVADTNTPSGAIVGWNTTNAPDNALRDDVKTANDPCPAGFRVPTRAQLQSLLDNNTASNVGPFTSPFNFGSAKVFGSGANKLTLPAAGYRQYTNGALLSRGSAGYYMSSTQLPTGFSAYFLNLGPNSENVYQQFRTIGFSVRCISE